MAMLAFALLAPWLLVLCFLYWQFPRHLPRTSQRRALDVAVIVLALLAAAASTHLAWLGWQPPTTDALGRRTGDIWPAVLAALYAYGAFSLVLLTGFVVRALLWRRPR